MNASEKIERSVREAFSGEPGEFRACAYFDEALDCIRIVTRDCSITETRANELLTILEATHPRDRKCVGFTIKGARHFCNEHGLSLSTPIELSRLLDAVLAACPDVLIEAFVEHIARPLVQEEGLEVVEIGDWNPEPA